MMAMVRSTCRSSRSCTQPPETAISSPLTTRLQRARQQPCEAGVVIATLAHALVCLEVVIICCIGVGRCALVCKTC